MEAECKLKWKVGGKNVRRVRARSRAAARTLARSRNRTATQKGLRDRISPTCTLSQNGYGDPCVRPTSLADTASSALQRTENGTDYRASSSLHANPPPRDLFGEIPGDLPRDIPGLTGDLPGEIPGEIPEIYPGRSSGISPRGDLQIFHIYSLPPQRFQGICPGISPVSQGDIAGEIHGDLPGIRTRDLPGEILRDFSTGRFSNLPNLPPNTAAPRAPPQSGSAPPPRQVSETG